MVNEAATKQRTDFDVHPRWIASEIFCAFRVFRGSDLRRFRLHGVGKIPIGKAARPEFTGFAKRVLSDTDMTQQLNPLEILIVLSADGDGRIPFPQGNVSVVSSKMKVMTELERRGYLHRKAKSRIDRSFALTDAGKDARAALMAARMAGDALRAAAA